MSKKYYSNLEIIYVSAESLVNEPVIHDIYGYLFRKLEVYLQSGV